MKAEPIILRPAQVPDVEEIWEVVHTEGKGWSIDQILKEIDKLFVLTYGKKLLGVLCGTFIPGRESVFWVVIHPMYPESSLRTAMIQGLWGVLCRRPQSDRSWESPKEHSLKKLFGARNFENLLRLDKSKV